MATTGAPALDDWQSGKTLSQSFDHLLTSSIASDVVFLVGESKKRINAHKLVLISRSPVFYAMFEGPMSEKGELTVPDVSEDTFLLFLRYLYTDTLDLTEENTVPVFFVARKYCVDILVARCEEFLNQTLSIDNACQFLELAHEFVIDNLKTKCLQLISEYSEKILQSRSFADLCPSCVTSITEYDCLDANEIDVYKAIMMWAEAECTRQNLQPTPDNKREVLGDILYTVRFPVMDGDCFRKEVCHHKVLPAEDVLQVINYQHHHEKVSDSKLKDTERKIDQPKRQFTRVWGIEFRTWLAGLESVSFSVSDSIQLLGFGSFYTHGKNTVNVVIYENSTVVYQADNITRVKSESVYIGDVLLTRRERIILKPGYVYTVTEETFHKRKYFGQRTLGNSFQFKHITVTFRQPAVKLPNVKGHNGYQIPYFC